MGCNTSKETIQQAVEEAKEDAKGAAKEIARDLLKDETKPPPSNGDVQKQPAAESNSSPSSATAAEPEAPKDHPDEQPAPEERSKQEEEAAIRIQAAFRGHHVRKSMKDESEIEPTKEQLEQEFRADDLELRKAATTIQANFRGHMSRKVDQATSEIKDALENAAERIEEKVTDAVNELEGIDLSDPGLNKAATKIQASFRGHKVRQEIGPEEQKK